MKRAHVDALARHLYENGPRHAPRHNWSTSADPRFRRYTKRFYRRMARVALQWMRAHLNEAAEATEVTARCVRAG